jgi:hypothetical protein
MTEVSVDATFLIATSWQALKRAKLGDERTMVCNCTIVILFAGFFIEANLNHIIDNMSKKEEMIRFLGNNLFPGLQGKLGWFYNQYVARDKARNNTEMYNNGISLKLSRKFPGFNKIYEFRNSVSHGVIRKSYANLEHAKVLRRQSKAIVDELFKIAGKAGFDISRVVTYEMAISSEEEFIEEEFIDE